jgi:hypothetical protein
MIFIAARHAAPTTCTPQDKQTRFSERNKDKRKTKQKCPGFEFKPRQVNDSSQSNQRIDHLVSHYTYGWYSASAGIKLYAKGNNMVNTVIRL